MKTTQTGFLSPKLHGLWTRDDRQRAVFARLPVAAGAVLAIWGGDVITASELLNVPPDDRRLALQVDEDMYLLTTREGPGDWINHSCNPNAGLRGQVVLVAMRDIQPGEEVCYDYCMSDGSDYDVFACHCSSTGCRGVITGEDWKRQELQARYGGYFSPYIARRIGQAEQRAPAPSPRVAGAR